MRTKNLLAGVALAGMVSMSGSAFAFDLNNCGGVICPWVTYGDGNSYALNLNAYMYDAAFGGGTGPGSPFYVNSTPGNIQDLVVNATGSGGTGVTTNFPNMDNAYPTPNGTNSAPFFSMNKTAYGINPLIGSDTTAGLYPVDPNPSFAGDSLDGWTTTTGALSTYLGAGRTPVFFFNNNQTKSGSTIDENLAVWARITLTGAGMPTLTFDFTNNGGIYGEPGGGTFFGNPLLYTSSGAGPLAGTNLATDYVMSGGKLCIIPNPGGYPGLIQNNPDGTCPAGTISIDNNLGANQAAYAVVFPELNAALLAGGYDILNADLRFGCDPNTVNPIVNCVGRTDNNGYEQVFIVAANGTRVPEPASLALLGIGLVGLVFLRRRRR